MLSLRPALGLALLRLTVGIIFAAHGYQKFFQYGIAGVTQGFTQMGIPLATVAAPAVATIEFIGGLLMIVGFYHRVAGALQACVMVGAIVFAKMSGGFFAPSGIEFELMLGVAALTIALAGGGAYTVEEMRRKP